MVVVFAEWVIDKQFIFESLVTPGSVEVGHVVTEEQLTSGMLHEGAVFIASVTPS